MASFAGRVLGDRYQIESLLGRQTGRRTFLATDLQTQALVVVKLLLFGPDFTWDDLKLFEREAEVLKSLEHQAIPRYLDCFETEIEQGKGFAMVQTYIEARSLQDWVLGGRTFSEEDIRGIALQLLEILDYLHSRNPPVIHRDIKPSNVLLQESHNRELGDIYVIDFGAVQIAEHCGTRTIVGTYGYMPPEQFGGRTVPESDLYALGATLIYLATGKHPDKLPQQDLKIAFAQYCQLSPPLIRLLELMTRPSLERRSSSVAELISSFSIRNYNESLVEKSKGTSLRSQLLIKKTPSSAEISITPQGIHNDNFSLSVSSILATLFGGLLLNHLISNFLYNYFDISQILILALIGVLTFSLSAIGGWLYFISKAASQVSIYIDHEEVFWKRYVGCFLISSGFGLLEQSSVKLEIKCLSRIKNSSNTFVAYKPSLYLWIGKERLKIGERDNLPESSIEEIAVTLSEFIDIPIERDT